MQKLAAFVRHRESVEDAPALFPVDARRNPIYYPQNPRRSCPGGWNQSEEMASMTNKALLLLILTLAATASAEWNEKVLYNFQGHRVKCTAPASYTFQPHAAAHHLDQS